MQNPVIQRIKRRAEVCQSLPVTCGRRGNDTGNDLVTVVSLQYAVDCFPENGKSSHSKPVTSPLPPSAKCRLDVFFALRSAYVRNGFEAFGSEYCHHFRIAGTFRFIHHSNLFGFFREQPNRRGYAKLAMTKIRTDFSEGS